MPGRNHAQAADRDHVLFGVQGGGPGRDQLGERGPDRVEQLAGGLSQYSDGHPLAATQAGKRGPTHERGGGGRAC